MKSVHWGGGGVWCVPQPSLRLLTVWEPLLLITLPAAEAREAPATDAVTLCSPAVSLASG